MMGKGNALPLAEHGAVCDMDVGRENPIAQQVIPVSPKLSWAYLTKRLLSAKIIQPSTLLWAWPIMIIVKKNGEDIRFCIDFRRVIYLTRLMLYPIPLINGLLQDMHNAMWYCSLDMSSGFWVVKMTEREILIPAFIKPSPVYPNGY